MCYPQPGLHDFLSYSLCSRPFQLINSGSHQVPIATTHVGRQFCIAASATREKPSTIEQQ